MTIQNYYRALHSKKCKSDSESISLQDITKLELVCDILFKVLTYSLYQVVKIYIKKMKIGTIFLFLLSLNFAYGYNILLLNPFPGKSHFMLFKPIIRGLLERGHHVTCITHFPFKDNDTLYSNYTEIVVDPPFDMNSIRPSRLAFEAQEVKVIPKLFIVMKFGLITSRYVLNSQPVKTFLEDKTQKFDIVISEQFFQESFLMFAHKFNATLVSVCTITYSDYMVQSLGFRTPYSFVPHYFLDYTDEMTFFERGFNTFVSLFDLAVRSFWYLPQQNKLAREVFGHLETNENKLPSVEDLDNSKSLLLANNHLAFERPQPKMPGMVNIGGITLTPDLNKLPENIQKFIDEAKFGVIYFSWGTVMNPRELPLHIFEMLVKTFSNLKQRVLWKCEGTIENLPPNVMIQKWMPQKEILAHPNVKLFISHGGLFGSQESLYYGVPMFITPFFGDQHKNAKKAEKYGFGLYVIFSDVTYEILNAKINEVLSNEKYRKRAKEISVIFRDNLVHPLNETMYWIEYVARHKGADHLKSHARNLNIAQYYLWDLLAVAFITFGVLAFVTYQILNRLFGRKETITKNVSKKVKKN